MSRCVNCGIEVADAQPICPLCHCVLQKDNGKKEKNGQEESKSGEADGAWKPEEKEQAQTNTYPEVGRRISRLRFAIRIYLFASIVAVVILILLQHQFSMDHPWYLLVGGLCAYGYLTLQFSISGSKGYRPKMFLQTFCGLLVVILIDFCLGFSGWSLNYVMPATILLYGVAVIVLMIVNDRNWQSYISVQIIVVLLSIVPLIFYQEHLITSGYPAIVCFLFSIFVFLGTVLIGGKRAVEELHRRFHV